MALGSLFVPEPVWLATDEGRSPWRHLRSIGSVAMAAGRLLPQWRLPAVWLPLIRQALRPRPSAAPGSKSRRGRGRGPAARRQTAPATEAGSLQTVLRGARRRRRAGSRVRGGATGRGRGRGAGGHSARKGTRAHLRGLRAAHGTPRLRPRARWHLCAAGSLSGWWLQNLWGSGSSLEESSLPPFSKCPRDFKYPGSQRVLAVRLFI